jgi:hypothetical protein
MLMRRLDEQLRWFAAQLEETRLIEAVGESGSAHNLKQAEAVSEACQTTVAHEAVYRELGQLIEALESGTADSPAVEARLPAAVQQQLRDPGRLAEWTRQASALVEQYTVARQAVRVGAKYGFPDLEPGSYTLLASSAAGRLDPRMWLLPIEVRGPIAFDLVADAARRITLQEALEQILLTSTVRSVTRAPADPA